MPPRHVYWTILIGNAPTAFRAHDRADLVPTFERLRQKQPDVSMKYFARGRLWESPEEARRDAVHPPPTGPRGRDWRPGGTHRDPRDRFKRKRDKPRFEGREERPREERRSTGARGTEARSPKHRMTEQRRGWAPKPKPSATPPAFEKPKPFAKPRPQGDRRHFQDRKPFGDRKPRSGDRKQLGDRKPSGDRRPSGDRKPFGVRKPFAAQKSFATRRPAPDRPSESKTPPEPPKEERVKARRRDGSRLVKKVRR